MDMLRKKHSRYSALSEALLVAKEDFETSIKLHLFHIKEVLPSTVIPRKTIFVCRDTLQAGRNLMISIYLDRRQGKLRRKRAKHEI